MRRALSAAYWIIPSIFCLALYWYGLKSWFRADDFAWLGLNLEIFSPADFWRTMFAPMAQGTIRPLSERAYFMGMHALFGLDALPYRIFAFATQFASLALASWVTWKLTGSRLAGFLAPVLWTANSALVTAMTWCSAYNEILCGFFLLLAFSLFLKYEETKRPLFYWLQFVVFVVGFGALEINVMYPALVASYIFLRRPRWRARRTVVELLPLFACSLIFTVVHLMVAPRQSVGPYVLHFDAAIPHTLWTYWKWVLVPSQWWDLAAAQEWRGDLGVAAYTVLLLGFVVHQARRHRTVPLVFLSWFFLLLLPILPLKDHVLGYYLTLPTIAVTMLAAAAFAAGWEAGLAWRAIGVAALAAYLFVDVPVSRSDTRWYFETARSVRTLVLGVARAHELHPASTILLADTSSDLYNNAVGHSPFRLLGIYNVYLTPESVKQITPHPDMTEVAEFALPAGPTLRGLERDQILVYEPSGDRLKNITGAYEQAALAQFKPETPARVDAGNPLFAYLLGPTWYPIENNYRWMPERATLRTAGPRSPNLKLHIHGSCPEPLTRAGALQLKVSVDGEPVWGGAIQPGETLFDRTMALPASSARKESIELELEVNRTLQRPDDDRKLGLAFGIFEIR